MQAATTARTGPLGMTSYQWLVLFAAWLGWGFDIFDGLLFNYVAPVCVPNLLGLSSGDPSAAKEAAKYTGYLTSALLLGWALGGVVFGWVTDKLGRTKTLLLTMLTYALATAACALAPNLWVLAIFRFIASLGIGGEWAAGASLVAETVPKEKRAVAGALLYTSAPFGIGLAMLVESLFMRKLDVMAIASFLGIAGTKDDISWRLVFAMGLLPAIVAGIIRFWIKEPEVWAEATDKGRVSELFSKDFLRRTLGGFAMALVALITWWSCNAFTSITAGYLATQENPGVQGAALQALKGEAALLATMLFAGGGLLGTLLTVPIATRLGRRPMFFWYFLFSALAIWITFDESLLSLSPRTRIYLMSTIGLAVFGVFGSFTFYLPELFPARLRGTGSGFCYNTGRVITAFFPFAIGALLGGGQSPLEIIRWVAVVPLVGVILVALRIPVETRGEALQ